MPFLCFNPMEGSIFLFSSSPLFIFFFICYFHHLSLFLPFFNLPERTIKLPWNTFHNGLIIPHPGVIFQRIFLKWQLKHMLLTGQLMEDKFVSSEVCDDQNDKPFIQENRHILFSHHQYERNL